MSEVFSRVEEAEDQICEIMDLFCDVQAEVCQEMVTTKDDLIEALAVPGLTDQISIS